VAEKQNEQAVSSVRAEHVVASERIKVRPIAGWDRGKTRDSGQRRAPISRVLQFTTLRRETVGGGVGPFTMPMREAFLPAIFCDQNSAISRVFSTWGRRSRSSTRPLRTRLAGVTCSHTWPPHTRSVGARTAPCVSIPRRSPADRLWWSVFAPRPNGQDVERAPHFSGKASSCVGVGGARRSPVCPRRQRRGRRPGGRWPWHGWGGNEGSSAGPQRRQRCLCHRWGGREQPSRARCDCTDTVIIRFCLERCKAPARTLRLAWWRTQCR